MQDILTQDEIDALLHGDAEGADGSSVQSDDQQAYDLTNQDRIVRGRMPTLEKVNERFARYARISMFNLFRRTIDVGIEGINVMKYGEYIHSLPLPTSLNTIRMRPLRGSGLINLDATLVFNLVDSFFGGSGRHVKVEGREFTPTELRVVQMVLERVFVDLQEAWKIVLPVEFEYQNSEVNPSMATIVTANDVVVVCSFDIELEGGGGALQVVMPYSMIEPIRDVLDAGLQSDVEDKDTRWEQSLREDVLHATADLECTVAEVKLTLQQVLDLKENDVIPIEMPELHEMRANGIPVLRGRLGQSGENLAMRVFERIASLDFDQMMNREI